MGMSEGVERGRDEPGCGRSTYSMKLLNVCNVCCLLLKYHPCSGAREVS